MNRDSYFLTASASFGASLAFVELLLRLVRRVRHDLARRVRVHARQLLVDADVRVVHVDDARAAKVPDAGVVDLSVRRRRAEERSGAEGLRERFTAAHRRLLLPGDCELGAAQAVGTEEAKREAE